MSYYLPPIMRLDKTAVRSWYVVCQKKLRLKKMDPYLKKMIASFMKVPQECGCGGIAIIRTENGYECHSFYCPLVSVYRIYQEKQMRDFLNRTQAMLYEMIERDRRNLMKRYPDVGVACMLKLETKKRECRARNRENRDRQKQYKHKFKNRHN